MQISTWVRTKFWITVIYSLIFINLCFKEIAAQHYYYSPDLQLKPDGRYTGCWIQETRFDIIEKIPVIVTIGLNLIFLINIVRVVVLKLRSGPASDTHPGGASSSTLQALRATLLLVPLLGLNFLLTPFRPEEGNSWEHAYEVFSAVTSSFQYVRNSIHQSNGEGKV